MSTFLTEVRASSRKRANSRSSSRQGSNGSIHQQKLKTSDVILESSKDIPILLSTIMSRPNSAAAGAIRSDSKLLQKRSTSSKVIDPLETLFANYEKKSNAQKKIPGVPFVSQSSRDNPVFYQTLPTPKDRTLYRIEDIRDKNLGFEDRRVIERERMTYLLERQRDMKEMPRPIPGLVDMKRTIGRDQHFLTKMLYPPIPLPNEDENTEQLSHFQLLLKKFEASEELFQRNGIFENDHSHDVEQEDEDVAKTEEPKNREEINACTSLTSPRIVGFVDMKRTIKREDHFLTKQLYKPPNEEHSDYWTKVPSTCVFDPKRAKVDRLLDKGNVLNWSRMSERKSLQDVHYDTNYDPIPVYKHTSQISFSKMTGRELVPSHAPKSTETPCAGNALPNDSEVQPKIKGGIWSKAPSRPKSKLATGEVYDYDRIVKRIKERERKMHRQLQYENRMGGGRNMKI